MKPYTRQSLAAIVLVTSCAYNPQPVQLTGPADDVAALVGEWAGAYAYDATGQRSGSIVFRLVAVGDTARGDVLMTVPWPGSEATSPPSQAEAMTVHGPAGQLLSIQFVRASRGVVTGALDAYTDPECNCILVTTFEGHVGHNRIEGTFEARRADTGVVQRGRWQVDRRS